MILFLNSIADFSMNAASPDIFKLKFRRIRTLNFDFWRNQKFDHHFAIGFEYALEVLKFVVLKIEDFLNFLSRPMFIQHYGISFSFRLFSAFVPLFTPIIA